MFNIIKRAQRRMSKLYDYHSRKAERYRKLSEKYAQLSKDHKTVADTYLSSSVGFGVVINAEDNDDWRMVC